MTLSRWPVAVSPGVTLKQIADEFGISEALFRIVMEAVTNAVRHAEADHVDVRIRYDDGLTVDVTDDGHGLNDDRIPGVGMRGMSDRADEIGGWVRTTAVVPHGTAVRAWLPAADHD